MWGRDVRPPNVETIGDRTMKIGSTVRFSETFLRDIDARSTPVGISLCYCVGTVTELDGIGDLAVATVNWTAASRMPRYNATKYLVVVTQPPKMEA